jgi:hypothetical protein
VRVARACKRMRELPLLPPVTSFNGRAPCGSPWEPRSDVARRRGHRREPAAKEK